MIWSITLSARAMNILAGCLLASWKPSGNNCGFSQSLAANNWGQELVLKNPADMTAQLPDQMDASAIPLITWQAVTFKTGRITTTI